MRLSRVEAHRESCSKAASQTGRSTVPRAASGTHDCWLEEASPHDGEETALC